MKGQQQKMLFCNCICAWQPVRVVHGDGHIRSLPPPVTVGELLKCHPHHFVCEPTSTGPLYHSGMLPFDMELEEGRIYLLLPLPRLLPHLASTFPTSCPCFSHRENMHSDAAPKYDQLGKTFSEDDASLDFQGQFLVAAKTMRKLRHRVYKSKLVRSVVRMTRRMLPDRLLFRFSLRRVENNLLTKGSSSAVGKSVQYSCSRNRWRPGLECISEVDLLTGLLNRDSEVRDR